MAGSDRANYEMHRPGGRQTTSHDHASSSGRPVDKRSLFFVSAALLTFIVILIGEAFLWSGSRVPDGVVQVEVAEVVGGDTINTVVGESWLRVHYIGVKKPESWHPEVCIGGDAALRRNRELVEDQTVYLEKDVLGTDQSRRLFRYVWLADGRMVNEVLLAEGYASLATDPPATKHRKRLEAAEAEAREVGRGLWGRC